MKKKYKMNSDDDEEAEAEDKAGAYLKDVVELHLLEKIQHKGVTLGEDVEWHALAVDMREADYDWEHYTEMIDLA